MRFFTLGVVPNAALGITNCRGSGTCHASTQMNYFVPVKLTNWLPIFLFNHKFKYNKINVVRLSSLYKQFISPLARVQSA